MIETFPHFFEHGYQVFGGWPPVVYDKVYPDQETALQELIPTKDNKNPVSNFTLLVQRLNHKDCLVRTFMFYQDSAN